MRRPSGVEEQGEEVSGAGRERGFKRARDGRGQNRPCVGGESCEGRYLRCLRYMSTMLSRSRREEGRRRQTEKGGVSSLFVASLRAKLTTSPFLLPFTPILPSRDPQLTPNPTSHVFANAHHHHRAVLSPPPSSLRSRCSRVTRPPLAIAPPRPCLSPHPSPGGLALPSSSSSSSPAHSCTSTPPSHSSSHSRPHSAAG